MFAETYLHEDLPSAELSGLTTSVLHASCSQKEVNPFRLQVTDRKAYNLEK